MKTAKTFLLVLLFISTTSHVYSEARAPQLIIIAFVEAIQSNDLEYLEKYVDLKKIQNQRRHSYSIDNLNRLFGKIDVKEIACSKPVYDNETKTILIRMNKPISFDFELQHQNLIYRDSNSKGKGDFYKIISIHP